MSRRLSLFVGIAVLLAAAGCSPEFDPPSSPSSSSDPSLSQLLAEAEGELLGNVYVGAERTESNDFMFRIEPVDSATIVRLSGTLFSQYQWIDPSPAVGAYSIEYFNPEADGPCPDSYEAYLQGDTTATGWGAEVHETAPGFVPSGKERHCIIPGNYRVSVLSDDIAQQQFFVEYLSSNIGGAGVPIATAPDGTAIWIEKPGFDPEADKEYPDLVLNFHINPSGSFQDTAILEIENAYSNRLKSTFENQSSLTGTLTDWFRYRTDRSSSDWDLGTRGHELMAVWWQSDEEVWRSGFFDHAERPVLRVHQYEGEVDPPATIFAGLEVKRPDEDPATTPAVTRSIFLQASPTGPTACFDFEPQGSSTWRSTDQFLDAGCSTGTGLEYSWDFGSGFGAFKGEPLEEFSGHATAGTKPVKLRVREAAAPAIMDTMTDAVVVAGDRLNMTGPAYVTDKFLKTYTASVLSDWYERFDPDTLTAWYPVSTTPATVYRRIWPAGDYTRGLRAEKTAPSPLGRGRIDVIVCHASIPDCAVEMVAAVGQNSALQGLFVPGDWGVFGAGPWISSEDALVRFYDLTGLHEPGSSFASPGWLDLFEGEARAADGDWTVRWERLAKDSPDLRVVEFDVEPPNDTEYRFGFAVDPDLGESPADDRAGYDSDRALVYAYDGTVAFGLLLRQGDRNALRSVEQYGARQWAPRTDVEARSAVDRERIALLDGEDDVHYLLAGNAVTGLARWTVVLLRAGTVKELKLRADDYLAGAVR